MRKRVTVREFYGDRDPLRPWNYLALIVMGVAAGLGAVWLMVGT